jgi:GNAT superfamily N-acetyltransferase
LASKIKILKIKISNTKELIRVAEVFNETDIENYSNPINCIFYNYLSEWSSPASNRINHLWVATNELNDIVGAAILKYKNQSENQDMARIDIRVLKEYRRVKVGTMLMNEVCVFANSIGRFNLTIKSSLNDSSKLFLSVLGAVQKDSTEEKQLDLKNVNQLLLKNYCLKDKLNKSYKIEMLKNDTPYCKLNDLSIAKSFLNDMPVGERSNVIWTITPYWITQEEITRKLVTDEWWTFLLYHENKVIGYTDIEFYQNSDVALQIDTAINLNFRNRGLAKWLKSNLIYNILCFKPTIKNIRTLNSSSNFCINHINKSLGFKEIAIYGKWVVKSEVIINNINKYGKISHLF